MRKLLFREKYDIRVLDLQTLSGIIGQKASNHPEGTFEKTQSPEPPVSADGLQFLPGISAYAKKDHSGVFSAKPKGQKIQQAEKPKGGQCTYYNIKNHPTHLATSLWAKERGVLTLSYYILQSLKSTLFAFFRPVWYSIF